MSFRTQTLVVIQHTISCIKKQTVHIDGLARCPRIKRENCNKGPGENQPLSTQSSDSLSATTMPPCRTFSIQAPNQALSSEQVQVIQLFTQEELKFKIGW